MVEKSPQNQSKASPGYAVDRRLCGVSQVPAEYYERLTGDTKGAKRIALGRKVVVGGAAVEAFGRSLVTHGLETGKAWAVISGTAITMTGGMAQTSIKNRNGARWGQALNEKWGKLGAHKSAISEALGMKHISPDEISRLSSLSTDVYNSEFKSPQLEEIKNVMIPMSSGAAMGLDGNYFPATALGIAGISTVPVGRSIYLEHFRRAAAKRIAQAALHIPFMKSISKDHVRMTDKMNSAAYIPDWMIAGFASMGSEGYSASIYAALIGSKGYNNILYGQKDKEETQRTTKTAIHLIEELSSAPFIATPQRWHEHISSEGADVYQEKLPFSDGIMIKDFIAKIPSGETTNLAPLNLAVQKSGAAIVRAKSGDGKSVTLMGIMHLYEHTGAVHLVEDSSLTDVHTLSGPEEIAEKVLLITKDQLDPNDRIIDLFKSSFKEAHNELYEAHLKKYDPMLVESAWATADNLLEEDIEKLAKGERSVFPVIMEEDLKNLREKRNEWVNGHIQEREGNLKRIKAEKRTFENLSDGQERSMMTLLAKVAAQVKKRVAIILDEPLAGLDGEEKEKQIKELRKIQDESGVALILVSHDNIDELQAGLNDCQLIDLGQNQ